jgi:hypothetical protein
MTDAELVREIAQPLTDQWGDYDALNQSGASTRTHSQSWRETKTHLPLILHEGLSECDASSHRFHRAMGKDTSRRKK